MCDAGVPDKKFPMLDQYKGPLRASTMARVVVYETLPEGIGWRYTVPLCIHRGRVYHPFVVSTMFSTRV